MSQTPHLRRNALTGEWLLVSPQRAERPWQGLQEPAQQPDSPQYDPNCYLCPGNRRTTGAANPDYTGAFAFDNDFPALLAPPDDPTTTASDDPFFAARAVQGVCRVVCYTERHDLRLATMSAAAINDALAALFAETRALEANPHIRYVQLFENRGEMMGCSNPHPHAQVWATSEIPEQVRRELATQRAHFDSHGQTLLGAYLARELGARERIVCAGEHFVSLVPWWAVWPFETLLLPRRDVASAGDISASERADLAHVLGATLRAYETHFAASVPYSMGFHPEPCDGEDHPEWVFHGHIYPPLLRSASVRKHLVGFEMLAMPQRDLTPEQAAAQLRDALA